MEWSLKPEVWSFYLVVFLFTIVTLKLVKFDTKMPAQDGKNVFTSEELKKYDGSDSSLPLLLAIKGQVFDVTKNSNMYTQGSYGVFLGKDASYALGKSSISPQDCHADYSKLNEEEVIYS